MINRRVRDIRELKDSRLLYDKEPPAFGYILLTLVAVFMLVAAIVAIKVPKIYVVKAKGTVTGEDSGYVMCPVTGQIDKCYMKEGMLVEEGDVLFTVKSTDYDLQGTQLEKSRENYAKQLEKYELLVKSIKDDVNYFENSSDDAYFYSTYEKYKSEVAQAKVDVSTYKAYGYTDDQIKNALVANEDKIMSIYYAAIQQAENQKSQIADQLSNIDAQLLAISSGKESFSVTASSSGVLHLLQEYKSGMVLQTTTAVATITPENSKRILKVNVSPYDKARIKEGDEVQIAIDGLAQNSYGTISGKVIDIDSNVTVGQNYDGSSYQAFGAIISLEQDYLVGASGTAVKIENGMSAEARITYDKISYMDYMLEKLGFKIR